METCAPSPLDAHLGFWLRFVSNAVSGRFQAQLAAAGATVSEWVALRALHEGPLGHAELIQALGMTKGAASKLLTRLEARGLAQRELVPGKARQQRLALTATGRALVPQLAALADANDAHFFGHLPPEQQAALKATLQGLVAAHGLREVPVG